MGGPPAWGLGRGLTSSHHKKQHVMKRYTEQGLVVGSCEYGNQLSGSLNGRKFFN
jgi:hypothetical protein